MPQELARDLAYEATLFQVYAAGLVGDLKWHMIGMKSSVSNTDILAKHGPRYSKVFECGPVDWSNAEIVFIQNTEAIKSSNGLNYSCVPFVEKMLSLHLGPVHYLTDDYLIYNGLARQSAGLEQVSGTSIDFSRYKAIVVDRCNLDRRVSELLESLAKNVKIFWIDDIAKLETGELASFLVEAGVNVDTKTPEGIQIAIGPEHIVLYRRQGEGGSCSVYPSIHRQGVFSLVDESGKIVFAGNSEELQEKGIIITLDKWRSLILKITSARKCENTKRGRTMCIFDKIIKIGDQLAKNSLSVPLVF